MKQNINEVEVNGQIYVKKEDNQPAEKLDGLDYVIVRGDRSGVFAGYLKSRNDREVLLLKARRIWYWDGANSISQLAVDGTSKPENCKFPCEVGEIQILDAIEVINCTEKSRLSIQSVKIWDN
jgi:hypothetical protein